MFLPYAHCSLLQVVFGVGFGYLNASQGIWSTMGLWFISQFTFFHWALFAVLRPGRPGPKRQVPIMAFSPLKDPSCLPEHCKELAVVPFFSWFLDSRFIGMHGRPKIWTSYSTNMFQKVWLVCDFGLRGDLKALSFGLGVLRVSIVFSIVFLGRTPAPPNKFP